MRREGAEKSAVELMCSLFYSSERGLYDLVRTFGEGHMTLPSPSEPLGTLCDEAIKALLRYHGTLPREFFDELIRVFPGETARIEENAAAWGVAVVDAPPMRRLADFAIGEVRDLLRGVATCVVPYTVGGATHVLRLRHDSAEIRRIAEDGAFGAVVRRESWASGWTSVRPYVCGDRVYLFALRESDGAVMVRRIGRDGAPGEVVQQDSWAEGFTSAEFWPPGAPSRLFLLRARDGACLTRTVAADGTIGAVIDSREYADGWTTARFYEVRGGLRLFLLRAGDGAGMIAPVERGGDIGPPIQQIQWAAGWTTAAFLRHGDETRLLALRGADGAASVHRVGDDGTIGDTIERHEWSGGWRDARFFATGGRPFLLLSGDAGALIRKIEAAPLPPTP